MGHVGDTRGTTVVCGPDPSGETVCRFVADVKEVEAAAAGGDPARLNALDDLPRYVTRLVQLGRPDLAADVVREAGRDTPPERSVLERVIEQNELMAVAFFARGMIASRAVGRVVVRDGAGRARDYGTGFMVSSELLMTNHHVLPDAQSALQSVIEFDHALGLDGQPMPSLRFRFQPGRFFETARTLDFTLVAVEPVNDDGVALASRGWIHLIAESGKAIVGEPINIIQHPGGERQQIAIRENRVVRAEDDFLVYSTDTRRGSSGAPALNDQWQLAALHHAGVAEMRDGVEVRRDGQLYREGIDDPESIRYVANRGIRVSRIVAEMEARDLPAGHRAMFEAAKRPAPLAELLSGVLGGVAPASLSGVPAGGLAPVVGGSPAIGPDGAVRWTLEVRLGPASGVPAAPLPPARAPEPSAESLFDPRGPYLDEGADAAAAAAYYAGIDPEAGPSALFAALHDRLRQTHTHVLSYAAARHDHLYPWIDRHEDRALRSVYSDAPMPEELFVAERMALRAALVRTARAEGTQVEALGAASLEAADAALEATMTFNAEHVVPQSWFEGAAEARAQKSDLHHLFACEPECNSFRSNIPYSEFTEEEERRIATSAAGALEALRDPTVEAVRPMCGLRDGRRFEPAAGKGAVARATLYFVLRYPGIVGDVKSGSRREFLKSDLPILLDWARAEPPSRHERHRNFWIAEVQGNRNPLIDRPDWLDRIAFADGFA
ncbi:endonuclease [Roseivivax isoporae]|uniref:Serine protease n=1 Tax=Roseivivax isoporae LMG 25204 TaxID=1449351 RepID=X7FBP1_9RHOB|nr:endonuclease [Roseivivax isoporae]ETX30133.1 hypothetical protein RISW2_18250 [Roseivivax isoporae LMG 25204]